MRPAGARARVWAIRGAAAPDPDQGPRGGVSASLVPPKPPPRGTTMQCQLATCHHDASTLAAALRGLDPDARVTLDAARGRLEVLASATGAQVLAVLQHLGCGA